MRSELPGGRLDVLYSDGGRCVSSIRQREHEQRADQRGCSDDAEGEPLTVSPLQAHYSTK